METNAHRVHPALRVVVKTLMMICLLGLTTIPFSSFTHAATETQMAAQAVAQANAADMVHGCPLGYVCIYPEGAGWNNDQPEAKYYEHGLPKVLGVFLTFEWITTD